MFYKIVNIIYVNDKDAANPTFFAELYQEEMGTVYYRTLLQAQQALDAWSAERSKIGDLAVKNVGAIVKRMKLEDYIKTIIADDSKLQVVYTPRRKYSALYGKALSYSMIKDWPEYLEEVYV